MGQILLFPKNFADKSFRIFKRTLYAAGIIFSCVSSFSCRDFSDPVMGVLSSGGITVESVSAEFVTVNAGGVLQSIIVWHADRDGDYSIRLGAANCSTGTVLKTGSATSGAAITTTLLATQLSAGSNSIWICVVPVGNSVGFAQLTLTRDDTAPLFAGLKSVELNSSTQITLGWLAAVDNASAQADIVYDIYQATTAGAEDYATPTYSTSPGATSYAVTITAGTKYYFVVRARDQAGNRDTNTIERNANAIFVDAVTGNDSNPGTALQPKLTIQNAVNASQSEGLGRPVLVSKGTYNETVTMAPNVSLYGGFDAQAGWTRDIDLNPTTIEATSPGMAAVTFNNAAITNLTMLNGFILKAASGGSATNGILVSNGSPTILGNIIYPGTTIQLSATSAVGIRITGGAPTIEKVTIYGGTQKGGGHSAGISVSGGAAIIKDSVIEGGSSNSMGCAAIYSAGIVTSVEITVQGNTIYGSTANTAGCTGSAHVFGIKIDGGAPRIFNNVIHSGTLIGTPPATVYASAIYCNTCSAFVRNNTLASGSGMATAQAHGITLDNSAKMTIQNNIIFSTDIIPSQQYGIAELTSTSEPISIENNLIFGFSTALYWDENSIAINDIGSDCLLDGAPNNELDLVGGTVAGNRTLCGAQNIMQVFVNPGGSNFHLKPGSPAIDVGKNLAGIVDTDKDNRARPQGPAWDIGAYEH